MQKLHTSQLLVFFVHNCFQSLQCCRDCVAYTQLRDLARNHTMANARSICKVFFIIIGVKKEYFQSVEKFVSATFSGFNQASAK